tara:strand:+ start:218 stop:421 length:204 start_codon:yes stop_codon:yes gene_type:complete
MKNTEITKDKWQIMLDSEIVLLKQCQVDHRLDSCMKCEKLLNCTIRDKYIQIVYESMNKGSGGGFEF